MQQNSIKGAQKQAQQQESDPQRTMQETKF